MRIVLFMNYEGDDKEVGVILPKTLEQKPGKRVNNGFF